MSKVTYKRMHWNPYPDETEHTSWVPSAIADNLLAAVQSLRVWIEQNATGEQMEAAYDVLTNAESAVNESQGVKS